MTTAEIVNRWFLDQIATGEIARFTPAYNQAYAALSTLVERLDAALHEIEPAPAPAPTPEPATDDVAAPEKD